MNDDRRHDLGPTARRRGLKTLVRENWYRDVWLFIISVLGLVAVAVGISANSGRIGDIQESRLDNCISQNRRHDNAVTAIDAIIGAMPEGKQKQRAKDNRQFTVLFIDALVPKVNCRQRVGPSPTAD